MRGSCGFSFGENCSSSKTGFDLFAGNKPRAKTPEEVV
jgi:nitrate reductase beta subunit